MLFLGAVLWAAKIDVHGVRTASLRSKRCRQQRARLIRRELHDERVILWEMALDAPLTASTMG